MHRFFISPATISKQQFHSTDKELCHQVSKVLKTQAGKKVVLCDNSEQEYEAEWTTVSRSVCEAKIVEKRDVPDISSEKEVHLLVALLKNQNRWELILEKGTEIGVAGFTPLITERTEVESLRKLDRLERIVKEAAEQSGRTKLPVINEVLRFEDLFGEDGSVILSSSTPPSDPRVAGQRKKPSAPGTGYPSPLNLIPTLHEHSQTLSKVLNSPNWTNSPKRPLRIFIGPAGGFTEEEVQMTIEHNFYSISLGRQVLRSETAALVAAYQCLSGCF